MRRFRVCFQNRWRTGSNLYLHRDWNKEMLSQRPCNHEDRGRQENGLNVHIWHSVDIRNPGPVDMRIYSATYVWFYRIFRWCWPHFSPSIVIREIHSEPKAIPSQNLTSCIMVFSGGRKNQRLLFPQKTNGKRELRWTFGGFSVQTATMWIMSLSSPWL